MLDLRKPLMLDGDIPGALSAFGPGPDVCPAQWLVENPGLLLNVTAAYRDAGADILPSRTFSANELRLSDYELGDDMARLNTRLVELARSAAPQTAIAGGMGAAGHPPEPFGPLPYTDLIDTYAEQALVLAGAGAQVLLLEGMPNLTEARAAALGARQAELPVMVCLPADGAGLFPLAALVCLQELGIAAFGLSSDEGPQALLEPMRLLAPHAKVPLLARCGMEGISPDEVISSCWELLAAGVRILCGGNGASPAHMQALRILLDEFDYDSFPPPAPSEDPAILLCDDNQVYYLDGHPVLSGEIACQEDMSTVILGAESEAADVLLFRVRNIADAYLLGQNAHLCRKAVCLLADSEEALEMALLYYNGRALISPETRLDREIILLLAKGYGAVWPHNH